MSDVTYFLTDIDGLKSSSHVEHLQEKAQVMLHDYTLSQGPRVRFGQILLKLPLLTQVAEMLVEKHFFKGKLDSINVVPVEPPVSSKHNNNNNIYNNNNNFCELCFIKYLHFNNFSPRSYFFFDKMKQKDFSLHEKEFLNLGEEVGIILFEIFVNN